MSTRTIVRTAVGSIVGIALAGSAVLVLLLPPGRLLVFRLYSVRGGSIQRLNET